MARENGMNRCGHCLMFKPDVEMGYCYDCRIERCFACRDVHERQHRELPEHPEAVGEER